MIRRRLALTGVITGIMILCLSVPAFAWEFNMAGSATNSYIYVSQQGSNGLLGPNGADGAAPFGGASKYGGVNAWLGPQAGNLVSGSDGATNSVSTSFFPNIVVNQAISMGGVYRIGNGIVDQYPGVGRAFSTGEWTQWWIGLDAPWGRVAYGKRPFGFGCGLQFDQGNRTQEHLALVTYSGPLSIGLGLYPYRLAPRLDELGERMYNNLSDKSQVPNQDLFGFVHYDSGPAEMGFGGTYYQYHQGPESFRGPSRLDVAPLDVQGSEGWIFLKYNNGRFFFNAETDWTYRTARWQRSLNVNTFQSAQTIAGALLADNADGSGSLFRPQYTQAWRYMAEAGALCGPAKISLLYAFVPGPDRRNGVLIDRQAVITDLYRPYNTVAGYQGVVLFDPDQSNATVFRPYSMIMVGNYGTGLGFTYYDNVIDTAANLVTSAAVGRSGDGYLADAMGLGARLDYAAAANLNLYGSFFYAKRASKSGYGWGFVSPIVSAAPGNLGVNANNVEYRMKGAFGPANAAPSIPDDGLGWEVDLGIDWNLLESWQLSVAAGYWKPGKWFNYACVDKSVANWDVPVAGNNWGTRPGRDIAPIFQFTWSLSTNF
jgi:hypothetical protein